MIVGTGFFSTSESTSSWTQFMVPMNLIGGAATEVFLYLNVSGPDEMVHEGTEFFIDNLRWDGATGIGDQQRISELSAAPNPASDRIELQFNLPEPDRLGFEVITPQGNGQTIPDRAIYHAGKNYIQLDFSYLPRGIYYLRAMGDQYSFIKKLVDSR